MPIDPMARQIIDQLVGAGAPPLHTLPIELARQAMNAMASINDISEPMARVEDHLLPGPAGDIPVRIYWPNDAPSLPGVVLFHGGGWALGDLETNDGISRAIAKASECVVVSVDYRLAPEHKFPAAIDDCYAATDWVAKHGQRFGIDVSRLAIGGDSAGGNLTAAVALMARDRRGPDLRLQWMIYPATDAACDTQSQRDNADGYLLTYDSMVWFWGMYLDESSRRNPYACPIHAEDLRGLPPALVQTAEFDPLRDEGERYAEALRRAGVAAELTRYDGMIHGFFSMQTIFAQAREALAEGATALRRAFA